MTDRLDITEYRISTVHLARPVTLALVTDMHNRRYKAVLRAILARRPDMIVIAGDMMSDMAHGCENSMAFLAEAARVFPVYYGFGNHENRLIGKQITTDIRATGVTLLLNEFVHSGPFCIGAILPEEPESAENRAFLARFCKEDGYRILICHRPEWYAPYLRSLDIPLILSGHAHGGQIRLFGHPIYSPGQGLFPRYAQGIHDGRLIVSRGLGNHTIVPRVGNRPELCFVTIEGTIPQ